MKVKKCSQCYRYKALDEFHRDKYQKDGRCASCKPCRSKQVWRAYKRRLAPQEDPILKAYNTLEEDNLKALESAFSAFEDYGNKPKVIKTRIVGAIIPMPDGIVVKNNFAIVETRNGKISVDLTSVCPREFAEKLAKNHIKIEL